MNIKGLKLDIVNDKLYVPYRIGGNIIGISLREIQKMTNLALHTHSDSIPADFSPYIIRKCKVINYKCEPSILNEWLPTNGCVADLRIDVDRTIKIKRISLKSAYGDIDFIPPHSSLGDSLLAKSAIAIASACKKAGVLKCEAIAGVEQRECREFLEENWEACCGDPTAWTLPMVLYNQMMYTARFEIESSSECHFSYTLSYYSVHNGVDLNMVNRYKLPCGNGYTWRVFGLLTKGRPYLNDLLFENIPLSQLGYDEYCKCSKCVVK